nr:hypothetical protein [Tanacetum cinerariifolium]
MTDYSLWEVILNGDSPFPTRVIEGVVKPLAPTTAEQRLARKNELKPKVSVVTSVFAASAKVPISALPNVDSLSDAVIYFLFASQSNSPQLDNDDLKQIDADDLEEMDLKWQMAMSPKDTRRNVPVETQRRNVPLETSTSNALVSQCDGVGSYDWSFQVEEEPTNYALMAFTSSSSSSSANEKFKKAEQERDELKLKLEKFQTSSKNLSQLLASQTNDKTGLGSDNQVFTSSMFDCDEMFSSESDVSMPASPVYDRYHTGEGYHVVPPPYIGTFMPPKPDLVFHDAPTVNETVHTAFNVELSPTKPDKDLSQSNRLSAPLIEDWVSDSEDEYEAEPTQNAPSFVQPPEHVKTPRPSVKPAEHPIPADHLRKDSPKSRGHINSGNKKACFVCKSLTYLIKDCDYYENPMVQNPAKNHAKRGNHQHYTRMPHPNPQRHVVPTTVLTRSKLVSFTAARPVTTVPHNNVTRPRPAKIVVTKPHSPPRRTINRSSSPKPSNFPPKVTTVKAPKGNPQHALKDKGVIDSGCSRHMTGNMSYLSNFEAINGGYVAFSGNPKGGKITGKRKISVLYTDTECIVLSFDFKLPDDNHVLLRVPRENNMYNVDLKNIVPSGDLTCLFAKATLDESNLWYRRLGHINFKTMNKLVKDPLGKFDGKADDGFLVGYSNTDDDTTFEVKESEFKGKKPELEVHVSPSSSAKTEKHDDKTKREAKGKSLVKLSTRFRNLSEEFEDFSYDSINEVNAASTLVHAVGQISTNNTNTFSAASPSNTAVSPTRGESSYVDTSQYHDDPNMPALDDITYSDDEEDVGAEADFTNLETTIIVSPILTTRVHKDHSVTTHSMTRMVKDQGGLTQINNEDFHTCMFAYFLSQEEPKRVHQALKDPSWIEAMQEELFQFTLQKVWVLVDLPKGKRAVGSKWEEGIDYEEVFAQVAMIESIRLFLAYASFMGFMVYQMDVKSAFLYGTIDEEVYVCQPLRFEDLDYLDKVYKVVKALYGLHQAPRAWYETLANYLLENGLQRGKIDQTLFIKKKNGNILVVQVYVDDIIFGSTNKDLCKAFEKLMKYKFQISSMGELTFFLGLQVKQKPDEIFISQDKYVAEILRKFRLTDGKSASIPIDTKEPLFKDSDGCALLRKKFKEDIFTSCIEHGIIQDSSEPSSDNTNVVNAPREPFVVNQDPDKNSSQSPPQINHHCCYGCGDPLEVPIIPNLEPFNNQTIKELPPTVQSFDPKSDLVHDSPNVFDPPPQLPFIPCEFCGNDAHQVANARYWKIPACYDDDDDNYAFAITPNEPDNSLSMGDEHLDTIPATKSNEFIKSSVENLVPNPSESEGEPECDMDSLFDEFAGELTLLKSIPLRIDKTDCYPEEETHFIKRLLYDNSSPRPPEEFVSKNFDAAIKSFSPSPIPVEDSDSLMEEIDLSFTLDYPMPPGIEEDDYDSERDILILKELLSNDSLSILENESFHFDIPSSFRPPAKPLDGNTGILNVKMMGDISKQKVPMPRLMITRVPNQEKSPYLLSHQGLEAIQPSAECPMMIHEKNTPILDAPFFHFYPP